MCESFAAGSAGSKQGGFALAAISVQPNDITPASARNLYVIYAVTNIRALQEAFRSAGIDSYESTELSVTYPSSMQTVLNVGGGSSPFMLSIDGDTPTAPQPPTRNSFNFVCFNDPLQTVFHVEHIESQPRPGYRGRGRLTVKEGTLLPNLVAGQPTYTALSVPMDFKGSIPRSHR